MTDRFKKLLDDAKIGWIFHPEYNQDVIEALTLATEAEQLKTKLSETVIHLAARNSEIEQLRKERDAMRNALDGAKALLKSQTETIEQLSEERDELAVGLILSDGCFTDEDCNILYKSRELAKKVTEDGENS